MRRKSLDYGHFSFHSIGDFSIELADTELDICYFAVSLHILALIEGFACVGFFVQHNVAAANSSKAD